MPTSSCFYVRQSGQIVGQIDLSVFPFIIGRARECHYVIDSGAISREHLSIEFDDKQVLVRDLGSRNGTNLNGETLTPHQSYPLRANDILSIADEIELVFDDPATTAQLDYDPNQHEGLHINASDGQAYFRDALIDPPLSPSQVSLLQLLIENEGVVVTREDIRHYVWGEGMKVSDQAMDALVSRMRKRLHEIDPDHEYIITRRGFGLIFRNRRPGYSDHIGT